MNFFRKMEGLLRNNKMSTMYLKIEIIVAEHDSTLL